MQLLVNRFYAPTHLFLAEEEKGDSLPYVRKSLPSKVSGKGKSKPDAEFEAERQWLLQQQDAYITTDEARLEQANDDDDDYEECEDGIECGCCFASYPFVCYISRVLDMSLTFVTRTRWCSVRKLIYSAKVACLHTHPTFWASTIPVLFAWISPDANFSFRSPNWNDFFHQSFLNCIIV